MPDDVLDILMSSGGFPFAKFEAIGQEIGGQVTGRPRSHQVREYDANNPGRGPLKFYPSGDPIMGVLIDVRVGAGTDDDPGIRRIDIDSVRKKAAVREALISAGAETSGIEPGGYFALTWTGTEAGKGSIDANTWEAIYRTPVQQAAFEVTTRAWDPVPARPTPLPTRPAPSPPPPPPLPAAVNTTTRTMTAKPRVTAVQAAAMANAGIDISQFDISG